MLELMKFYGEQNQLASMRGISRHVVVFSGKGGVNANSLSGPLTIMALVSNIISLVCFTVCSGTSLDLVVNIHQSMGESTSL